MDDYIFMFRVEFLAKNQNLRVAKDLFQESQESLRGATNLYRES